MKPKIAPARQKELQSLLDRLGIESTQIDWLLLDQAFVHPSFSTTYNNDHLEFFGDSVLKLAAVEFLRQNHGDHTVGELAALRSQLVSDKILAAIADSYGFDRFLVMGDSAKRDQKTVLSRLANSFEAFLGVLYLSTNDFSLIHSWLDPHLQRIAKDLATEPALGNYKTALQEFTQGKWHILPEYRIINSENNQLFMVEVWINDVCWGQGQGQSIKEAQQEAAAIALPLIQKS
jgi:ribonuclease III